MTTLYDYVTDCSGWDPQKTDPYVALVSKMVDATAYSRLLEMFDKDRRGDLCNDGLERGELSLEILSRYITFEPPGKVFGTGWRGIGADLQLLDDAIDYANDVATGETNAFSAIPLPMQRMTRIRVLRQLLHDHRIEGPFLFMACYRARRSLAKRSDHFQKREGERGMLVEAAKR